jgi:adenosyl cobinamide kinase/adenosyl cobinamide phosphate guanylyltransferase
MGKREIILISGGARSGKSRTALELTESSSEKIFVATALESDEEMTERIRIHRQQREKDWITIEEPLEIATALQKNPAGAIVIDCLTLWLSNMLLLPMNEEQIRQAIQHLIEVVRERNDLTVLVTNEVGFGIVPDNELARRFRDLAGSMNQNLAAEADTVILMVSGLPLYLKRRENKIADS